MPVTMPDPKRLRVGERVVFNSLPKEWAVPGYTLLPESAAFMAHLVKWRRVCRIDSIDEFGTPWITVRIRRTTGTTVETWGIFERTGWRRVR